MLGRLMARYRARRCSKAIESLHFAARGDNVVIRHGCTFNAPERISLGSDIYIGWHATLHGQGGLTIGSGAMIGPCLTVYTVNHRFRDATAVPYDDVLLPGPVLIGDNVWVGGNVIVLPGVEIGEGSIVGAGSVVTRSCPPCTILGGNPARAIGQVDEARYRELKALGRAYFRLKAQGIMVPHMAGEQPAAGGEE